ncbi:MAG: DegV family protein [Candidatus Izemoplasma sp.]|nr:DegV family protein [Candidatus Izemoplasma sp.]
MPNYRILLDSTTYLPKDVLEAHNIRVVSLMVTSDDGQSFKEVDISREYIIDKRKQGASFKTSQPAPGAFLKAYNDLLEQGVDTIFFIGISKNLSGTYQAALLARDMLDDPNRVICFDTLQAAYGNEMLTYHLIDLIKQDLTAVEIKDRMEVAIESAELLFTVENLFSLVKGGRLTVAKALIGSVLRVKPIIKTIEGRLKLYQSKRTYKKVYDIMINDIKSSYDPNKTLHITITHTYSKTRAEALKDVISKEFPEAKIRMTDLLGPVLTIHVGNKGFGISWFLS